MSLAIREALPSEGLPVPRLDLVERLLRQCTRCSQVKPLADYPLARRLPRQHYRAARCKDCCNELRRVTRRSDVHVDHNRKLPPYEELKQIFLGGVTYSQLAQRYGLSRRGAEMTLRARAIKRGEWPLLSEDERRLRNLEELHRRPQDNVKVDVIRDLLVRCLDEHQLTIRMFAETVGVPWTYVRAVRSPGTKTISVAGAVRILDAIGEPVPDWMRR